MAVQSICDMYTFSYILGITLKVNYTSFFSVYSDSLMHAGAWFIIHSNLMCTLHTPNVLLELSKCILKFKELLFNKYNIIVCILECKLATITQWENLIKLPVRNPLSVFLFQVQSLAVKTNITEI